MAASHRRQCLLDGYIDKSGVTVLSGITVGTIGAGLFNPWDRALYLSVIENRSFFHRLNWTAPFQGFWQSVWAKTLSGGLYFTLQAQMRSRFENLWEHKGTENFCVGVTAGLLNGAMLNQLATVKYYAWRRNEMHFWKSVLRMYNKGGVGPFFKGIRMTAARDVVFGCSYEVIRGLGRDYVTRKKWTENDSSSPLFFWADMTAAGFATVFSGPFNYVRSMQFASRSEHPQPSMKASLGLLWKEIANEPTALAKIHRLQHTLRIGWGTARVAVGMAVSQQLFESAMRFWNKRLGQQEQQNEES